MENRILTLYQTFRFKDEYWHLSVDERKSILDLLLNPSDTLSDATYHYQVSPSRKEYDFMIWYTKKAVEDNTADLFFKELGSIF